MVHRDGEKTRARLQALWDKTLPNEPRTIVKAMITGYKGRKYPRYVWIGERELGGETVGIELGVNAEEVKLAIKRRARRAAKGE